MLKFVNSFVLLISGVYLYSDNNKQKHNMETLVIELENKFTGELKIQKQHTTNAMAFKEMFVKGTKSSKWLLGNWNVSRIYINKN